MQRRRRRVGGRRLARYAAEALPERQPEAPARPRGGLDRVCVARVEPRIREEHRDHLLAVAVPHAQPPYRLTSGGIAVAEERRAGTSTPGRKLGRSRAARGATRGTDAKVKVPRLVRPAR